MTNVTEEIEKLIDATSLLHVMTALETICAEKAEHLRCNWQDNASAKLWERASALIGKTLRKEPICTQL